MNNIANEYKELMKRAVGEYVVICNPVDYENGLKQFKLTEIVQDPRVPVGTTYIMNKKDMEDDYLREREILEREEI